MLPFIWRILKEVGGLFFLLLTLLASVVFQLTREFDATVYTYPDNDVHSHPYFLLSDVELYRDTYYHYLMIYGIAFIVAVYLWISATKHYAALFIFALIHLITLVDYYFNYNETWFYYRDYPIGWNIIKVLVFSLAIINEAMSATRKTIYST